MVYNSVAEAREAPSVRKIGFPSSRENLVITSPLKGSTTELRSQASLKLYINFNIVSFILIGPSFTLSHP